MVHRGASPERSAAIHRTSFALFPASVVTSDPGAANNLGIETDPLVPNGSLVPGQNITFLAAEPFNATTQIAVGLFGFQGPTGAEWEAGYQLWNLTSGSGLLQVVNRSLNFSSGSTVVLEFSLVHGGWWSATADGFAIEGTGGNGTLDLGAPVATGYASSTSPFTSPTLAVESPVAGPPMTVLLAPALAWRSTPGRVGAPSIPNAGIWEGPSSGWNVVGDDQAPGLLDGQVEIGGNVAPAPATGDWLWGLSGPGFRPIANVTVAGSGTFPNTGIGVVVNLTGGAALGPNATSYLVTAWETVAAGVSVGVGVWVNAPGDRVVPFFVENLSGTLDASPAFTHPSLANLLRLEGTSTVNLTTGVPTGWWNFTLNGLPIIGATDTTNGSLPIGVNAVSSGPAPYLTVDTTGPALPSLTPLALDASLEVNATGTWTVPLTGVVAPLTAGCSPCVAGSPEEGYLQDMLLNPGSLQVSGDLPALAPGTVLWNGTGLPAAHLAVSGLPGQVGSLSRWPVHVWVNGSGSALPAPQVGLVLPSGVVGGLPWFPAGGGAVVNLTFPRIASPELLSLSFLGAAAGWSRGTATLSTWLVPGNLSVSGHLEGPALLPSGVGTLLLWVNGSEGAGPLTNASLAFQSPLGGGLGTPTFDPITLAYTVTYTAPPVTVPTNDSLAVLATVQGFQVGGGIVNVALEPRTLSLEVREETGGAVLAGSRVTFLAWINSSTGTPLNGATLSAAFGYVPLPPSVPTTVVGPGTYAFTLLAPLLAQNSSALVVVEAGAPGYGLGLSELHVEVVLQPIDVAVQVGSWNGGSITVALATSNGSGPVVGAAATLSAPGGTVSPPSLLTDVNGLGTFTWTPSSNEQGSVDLHLTVTAEGFAARNLTVTLTVPSAAGPLGVPRADWFLIAPLVVVVCFLALWAFARWRSGPPRPSLPPPPKGMPPEATEVATSEEGPQEEVKTFLPKDSLGLPPPENEPTRSATRAEGEAEAPVEGMEGSAGHDEAPQSRPGGAPAPSSDEA